MNKQEGLVVSANDETATIVIIRESACGGNCSMCHGGCSQKHQMVIPNTQGFCAGEKVYLCANTTGVLFLAFISFVLPLLLALLFYSLTRSDTIAVLTLLVCFICGTFLGNHLAKRPFFKTYIVKQKGD